MNVRKFSGGAVFWLGLLLSATVPAELTVIYDSGHTQPLQPLLKPLRSLSQSRTEESVNATKSLTISSPAFSSLKRYLPVRSPGLHVGELADTPLTPESLSHLANSGARPVFLIGADEVSLRWLAQNHQRLRALGAMGLLIQADTEQDVLKVAEVAKGLPMSLGSGSDLARALGVEYYPILITQEGVAQ